MAVCPHCNEILSDDWIKRQGARLMGRKGGKAKIRSAVVARSAALKRWGTDPPTYNTEEERAAARKEYDREYHRRRYQYKKLCWEQAAEAALLSFMNGNLRFLICPAPGGFSVICQYGNDEITWGPYQTLAEIAERIRVALVNLEKQS